MITPAQLNELEALEKRARAGGNFPYIPTETVTDLIALARFALRAREALDEIANDSEESSHERAETALWAAKSALKGWPG